jgi:hypothetical protein
MRHFLIQSGLFKEEDIDLLLDESFETVQEKLRKLYFRALKEGKTQKINVFIYASGHGTSVAGQLCLTFPT